MAGSVSNIFNPSFFGIDQLPGGSLSGGDVDSTTPIYTFETGNYFALKGFNEELSRLLNDLTDNDGEVTFSNGEKVDTTQLGGSMGLNLYLQTLDAARIVLRKIGQKGLDAQNQSLTSHKI